MYDSKILYRPKDADKLKDLHPDLARVIYRAAQDGARFIVIETMRGRAKQNAAFKSGHSKAIFGKWPHNFAPALAVDIGPTNYPGVIPDYRKLSILIKAAAIEERVKITWGGDFKSIFDPPHFELSDWKNLRGKLAD